MSSSRRARRLVFACGLAAIALVAVDLARPPAEQWSNRALLAAVHTYRARISPHLAKHCRFVPSCSEYALAVLARHGALGGGARVAWRLVRCGPWTARGTFDPPDELPRANATPPPEPTRRLPP